jgi:thiol-disulfide isomerase/thioredoxin
MKARKVCVHAHAPLLWSHCPRVWQGGPVDRSTLTGLAVAVAALAVATAFGVWWRRRDGRLRVVARADQARSTVVGPRVAGKAAAVEAAADETAALAALGVVAGPVTLLQFSSAFCAPCRTTSRVCGEVVRQHPGVVHVEVDAESHLAEVRRLGVWRTPTLLVVDTLGRVAHRSTGAPAKARVVEAVTALLPVTT